MTDAAGVLCDLRAIGVWVELDGDEVRCRAPRGTLTPELVRRLKAVKPQVHALLIAEEADISWRAMAMRTRTNAAVEHPTDLVARDPSSEPDHCRSCGAPNPSGGTAKCVLCCLAAARVSDELRARRRPEEKVS